MPEDIPPTIIHLKDLATFTKEFMAPRRFRFSFEDRPGEILEVLLKPLTQAEMGEARALMVLQPPKKAVTAPALDDKGIAIPGAAPVESEVDDWANEEFQKKALEQTWQRRAIVLGYGMPEIRFQNDDVARRAEELQKLLPENYASLVEKKILDISTNEVAIINHANFSSVPGSAQS